MHKYTTLRSRSKITLDQLTVGQLVTKLISFWAPCWHKLDIGAYPEPFKSIQHFASLGSFNIAIPTTLSKKGTICISPPATAYNISRIHSWRLGISQFHWMCKLRKFICKYWEGNSTWRMGTSHFCQLLSTCGSLHNYGRPRGLDNSRATTTMWFIDF
jgi:hypothetical protein